MAFIYVKSKSHGADQLESFAEVIFRALNISAHARRESENYWGGEYFLGKALGVEVKVAVADDRTFSDYHYWIVLSPDGVWIEDKQLFESFADLVARFLTLRDYEVACDPSGGRIGGDKLINYRNADVKATARDLVQVKRVMQSD